MWGEKKIMLRRMGLSCGVHIGVHWNRECAFYFVEQGKKCRSFIVKYKFTSHVCVHCKSLRISFSCKRSSNHCYKVESFSERWSYKFMHVLNIFDFVMNRLQKQCWKPRWNAYITFFVCRLFMMAVVKLENTPKKSQN